MRIRNMKPSHSPLARSNIAVAIALAAALALIVACGGDEEAGNTGAEDGGPARQTVPVTATDFSFSPGTLTVQARDPFDFVLTNVGNASHTFTIDELDVDAEIAAGEETIVAVTSSDSGEFSFYCRFHRGQGMQGKITVSGGGGTTASAPTESPTEESPDDDYDDY